MFYAQTQHITVLATGKAPYH